jgi:hypothetical protein
LKNRAFALRPSHIAERRTTFAKAYGIKEVRCYSEIFGEKCPETCEFFAFYTPSPTCLFKNTKCRPLEVEDDGTVVCM